MVRQVTDTEPTMAKSSCWSIPACSVLWLPRLGGTLSAPAERRDGGSWFMAKPCPGYTGGQTPRWQPSPGTPASHEDTTTASQAPGIMVAQG